MHRFLSFSQCTLALLSVLTVCASQSVVAKSNITQVRDGAWGQLEINYIQIEPPLEYSPELRKYNIATKWFFSAWDKAKLKEFLAGSPLKAEYKDQLIQSIQVDTQYGGVKLEPKEELIINMSPESRRYIYNQLATFPINRAHDNARRYSSKVINDWMSGVELSMQTFGLLEKLIYQNGDLMFFADTDTLFNHIAKSEERSQVFQALSREKTMLISLRLNDKTDIHQLAQYWGQGGRAKNVYPLLKSLQNQPAGKDKVIDIVHFLPPFVKNHIYQYPDFNLQPKDKKIERDCHWTSLNFFNQQANDQYGRGTDLMQWITRDYVRINPFASKQLGDLILFADGEDVLHSATYIADDIIFTKNGANLSSPWMFMHLKDMLEYYPRSKPLTLHYLRKKQNLPVNNS